jgi:two-component system, chemotaxis family, response regulator WspF
MRVAIVNDLSLAREVLRRLVLSVPGYSVAWVAEDGDEAVRKAAADQPDVILMDLVMPHTDGVEATRRIMRQSPCPVLVVTATIPGHYELVIRAMGAGALDAVETPVLAPDGSIRHGEPLLARLAKLARLAEAGKGSSDSVLLVPPRRDDAGPDRPPLVLLAASTGGPDALAAVLGSFPRDFPAAVLIVQHIAPEFASALVNWLGTRCSLPVRAAVEGDTPTAATAFVAATNDHLEITPELKLRYTDVPHGNPYRPSADVLFTSAGRVWPRAGVAAVLTGMGSDGAKGLLRLKGGLKGRAIGSAALQAAIPCTCVPRPLAWAEGARPFRPRMQSVGWLGLKERVPSGRQLPSLQRQPLELLHAAGDGHLGRQALDAAGAEEADDALRVASTNRTSSGSEIGPPWQSTRMSGFTRRAASASACTRFAASASVSAVLAPMLPLVVSPMCGMSTSAPAFGHLLGLLGVNTYGHVSRPRSWASAIISTSLSKPMPVSSSPWRNTPSISPTVGKFCTPLNPASARRAGTAS